MFKRKSQAVIYAHRKGERHNQFFWRAGHGKKAVWKRKRAAEVATVAGN